MFDVLRRQSRNDVAYKIANQEEYPGWGFMLKNGATTLWETWSYPENFPSQNHPMFGSVDEWFYRSVLGINGITSGFEKMVIKPQPVEGLSSAKGEYRSFRGKIASSWTKSEGQFTLTVSIPPNTKAEIWVPSKSGQVLGNDGKPLPHVRIENGYAVVEVGCGNYRFVTISVE